MKIKKFNKEIKFVLCKYKGGWDNFYSIVNFENDQFVPGMIIDNELFITGQNATMNENFFEIIPNSDKKIQEIIDIYLSEKRYNL